ncbi:hypothetical protein JAAARDRAFT_200304 [Jaapia argillacea MUCL 33604]|uniref:Uncharacterized protein n=1 Tax=Jaapia argillacea MUCL 33604 TaxID=933084 RepID=A0A067PGC0_9AGAM|nr:hypothetical protein JAAARDRAFT_200304 [Jaapia argillacea MUCL 33604]
MALKAFADNVDHDLYVKDAFKEDIRAGALQALLKETVIRRGRSPTDDDMEATGLDDDSDEIEFITPNATVVDEHSPDSLQDGTTENSATTTAPEPAKCRDGSNDTEGYLTDNESATLKRSKAATGPRKKRKTLALRRAELENDPWVKAVEAQRIRSQTGYVIESGVPDHLSREEENSGQKRETIHRSNVSPRIPGNRTISAYFIQKLDSPGPSQPPTSPATTSPSPPSLGVTYQTKVVKANLSVSQIFKPVDVLHTPNKIIPPVVEMRMACQHLTDRMYTEYILRTHTRTLGGVSPTLRARLMRQIFPYKPFQPLKGLTNLPGGGDVGSNETDEDAIEGDETMDVVVKVEVPTDGNTKVNESQWTDGERRRFDKNLKGWARWEVKSNGRMALKDDESFKTVVRRKIKEAEPSQDKQQ